MIRRHLDDWTAGKPYTPIAYHWVARERIASVAFAAVIAAEDQRFFQHNGFDTEEILNALDTYFAGGPLRGASTITQQVAKNLFLTPARSFWRKGLEIWFTMLLEVTWDKQRILETYVNIAEFGDHLFGIEAASRYYFGVPAQQLTAHQAALLAAVLPNPLKYRVDRPGRYVLQRRAWILRQMNNLDTPNI